LRIERLDLLAFGKFTQTSIELTGEQNHFHIIYGPNESGKSTTLRALTAWLFGIPARSTDNYLHHYNQLRVGGKLRKGDAEVLECVRRKGNAKTLLSLDESTEIDAAELDRFLGGMNEETFLSSFGLDHDRLVAGGRSILEGGGDVGEILFSAGAGLARLSELKRDLENEARSLFLPSGAKPALNQTIADIKQVRQQLKDSILTTSQYRSFRQEQEEKQLSADEKTAELKKVAEALDFCKRDLEAIPLCQELQQYQCQWIEYATAPILDEQFTRQRRDAESDLLVQTTQSDLCRKQIESISLTLEGLHVNDAVLELVPRVESLSRRAAVVDDENQKRGQLQLQVSKIQLEINNLQRRLGNEGHSAIPSSLLTETMREAIWQLADQGLQIDQLLVLAANAIERCKGELAQLGSRDDLQLVPLDIRELDRVLRRIEGPKRLVEELGRARSIAKRAKKQTEIALSKLNGFSGSISNARLLSVPCEAAIDSIRLRYEEAESRQSQLEQERRDLRYQQVELESLLEGLRQNSDVPSESDLARDRQHRNSLVDRLEQMFSAPLPTDNAATTIQELRELITRVDQGCDRMRHASELVAKRSQAQQKLAELSHRQIWLENEVRAAAQIFDLARQDWQTLWEKSGVSASTPPEMNHWLSRYQTFLAAADASEVATDDEHRKELEIENFQRAIVAALKELDIQVNKPLDGLVQLTEFAAEIRDRETAKVSTRQAALAEVSLLENESARLSRELAEARQQQIRWTEEWQKLNEQWREGPAVSPKDIRSLLKWMDELQNRQQELESCRSALQEMEKNSELFANDTRLLVDAASTVLEDMDLSSLDPVAAATQLALRMEKAKSEAQQRSTLLKQRDEHERQLQRAKSTILQCNARLQTLCNEVGGTSPDQLPEIERRSAQRQRLETQIRQTELQLQRLANGKPLDEFVQRLTSLEKPALETEIHRLEERTTELQQALVELNQDIGALRQRGDAMNGESQAADLNQTLIALYARAEQQARDYALLTVQSAALHNAIEIYRQEHQGPILCRAERLFSQLTCGDYCGLKAQFDERGNPILVGLRGAAATSVPANCMSEGTADALYMALRLATYLEHVERHGAMPLVIDDCLIQFDDDRATAALTLLSSIGENSQVIFFTHHHHLVELANTHLSPSQFQLHCL
jgi:uncharacterized protein YhaN